MKRMFGCLLLLMHFIGSAMAQDHHDLFDDAHHQLEEPSFFELADEAALAQDQGDFYFDLLLHDAIVRAEARQDFAWMTQKDTMENTPLMIASFHGWHETARRLLTYPSVQKDLNARNARGMSAWMFAVFEMRQSYVLCHLFSPLGTPFFYYTNDPYGKTRAVLQQYGAQFDAQEDLAQWNKTCPSTPILSSEVRVFPLHTVILRKTIEALKQPHFSFQEIQEGSP